jgi:hypothetical protein
MIRQLSSAVVAATVCAFGFAPSALAQLYNAPNVNSVQSRIVTPNVNFQTNNLQQQQLNSGYSGVRNPSLAAPMPYSGGGSRINFGVNTASRGSKPFSSYQSSPTVSPYLNLFRTDLQGGGNFNYSTLVQPQLQQQQLNQQLERQTSQTNRRLQTIAAQSDYNAQGSKDQYPTGHQTVFNYMGHYYQPAQVKQKRSR